MISFLQKPNSETRCHSSRHGDAPDLRDAADVVVVREPETVFATSLSLLPKPHQSHQAGLVGRREVALESEGQLLQTLCLLFQGKILNKNTG